MKSLSLRQILSVDCPTCRAKPRERCTLTTGQPCVKTHHSRGLTAAKVRMGFGQSALRIFRAFTTRRVRIV
jgi:hypothetical protein